MNNYVYIQNVASGLFISSNFAVCLMNLAGQGRPVGLFPFANETDKKWRLCTSVTDITARLNNELSEEDFKDDIEVHEDDISQHNEQTVLEQKCLEKLSQELPAQNNACNNNSLIDDEIIAAALTLLNTYNNYISSSVFPAISIPSDIDSQLAEAFKLLDIEENKWLNVSDCNLINQQANCAYMLLKIKYNEYNMSHGNKILSDNNENTVQVSTSFEPNVASSRFIRVRKARKSNNPQKLNLKSIAEKSLEQSESLTHHVDKENMTINSQNITQETKENQIKNFYHLNKSKIRKNLPKIHKIRTLNPKRSHVMKNESSKEMLTNQKCFKPASSTYNDEDWDSPETDEEILNLLEIKKKEKK